MLELKNVSKYYGDKRVLENFSLRFPESGVAAMLGKSGCGKTTLLRLIAGLETPDAGEISFPKKSVISMVFQEDRLLESLDVRGNILAVTGKTSENLRVADECLERCGLSGLANARISSLAGGMKRRVAIARAIAFGGDILLLDEPFKGLDDETKHQVCEFVFENSQNRLTLFVTHDKAEAEKYAQTILHFAGTPLGLTGETT